MIVFAALCAVGLVFCWLAFLGWRHRREESISLIEAGILKVTGEEPLPLTRFDRRLQTFQLLMMSMFGPATTGLGAIGLLHELGAI